LAAFGAIAPRTIAHFHELDAGAGQSLEWSAALRRIEPEKGDDAHRVTAARQSRRQGGDDRFETAELRRRRQMRHLNSVFGHLTPGALIGRRTWFGQNH
jgi:hypothetical protein